MINGLKPYRAYKDSGVEWLGEVPEHWEVRRGKTLFRCIDVRSSTGEEELLTVSSERGVVPRVSANVTMFKAESYVGYKLCWPGDLVINSLWAWARGLGVSRYHGIVSSAYGVYRLRRALQETWRFINDLLRSTPFQWELQVRSKGIWISRLQLTDEAFLGAPFPMPPLPEQAAIVRFLDWSDRRIRRVIRTRQRRIKLLEEYKQALIQRAVTGQIDVRTGQPYPAYKPSGIEWLGQVPEHWEVVRLKRLCRIQGGYAFPSALFADTGVSVIRMNNLRRGTLDVRKTVRIPKLACLEAFSLQEGDILYGLSGSVGLTGSLGNFALVRESDLPAQLNQRVARLVPRTNRNLRTLLLLWIQTAVFYEQVLLNTTGTAQFNVSTMDIERVLLVVPPRPEQSAIVGFLNEGNGKIDAAIAADRRVIDLLKEFRTRLIADVVTGKVDVRDASAQADTDDDELEEFVGSEVGKKAPHVEENGYADD